MTPEQRRQHRQAKQIAYTRAKQWKNWSTAQLLHAGEKAGKFDARIVHSKLQQGIVPEDLYDYCVGVLANQPRKARKR